MVFALQARVVVGAPDSGLLEGSGSSARAGRWPRVIGLGQPVLHAVLQTEAVEGMAAPSRGEAVAVLRQVGKLDAVVRQHRVDLVRHDGDELAEKLSRVTGVAFVFSRAKAYLEVRSTATKR